MQFLDFLDYFLCAKNAIRTKEQASIKSQSKLRTSEPQQNFTGSPKKACISVYRLFGPYCAYGKETIVKKMQTSRWTIPAFVPFITIK